MINVGVDLGGTKTQLRASVEPGRTLDAVRSSDQIFGGSLGGTARRLAQFIRESVPVGTGIGSVVVGAHGCDTPRQCGVFQERLTEELGVRSLVVNDAELLLPAAGLTSGVGVVAGTGSVAVGYRRGELLVVGGWGWILGDEGSAPALVREAAREVLRLNDLGEHDVLADFLLETLDVPDLSVMSKPFRGADAAAVGRFAPMVFAAAESGSAAARRVIDDGGRALAHLVRVLGDRGADTSRVVLGGGVVVAQPRLHEACAEHLARNGLRCELTILREPPVVGALALAESAETGSPLFDSPAHNVVRS